MTKEQVFAVSYDGNGSKLDCATREFKLNQLLNMPGAYPGYGSSPEIDKKYHIF